MERNLAELKWKQLCENKSTLEEGHAGLVSWISFEQIHKRHIYQISDGEVSKQFDFYLNFDAIKLNKKNMELMPYEHYRISDVWRLSWFDPEMILGRRRQLELWDVDHVPKTLCDYTQCESRLKEKTNLPTVSNGIR